MNQQQAQEIITKVSDQFHHVYYSAASMGLTWAKTQWLGVPVLKCPLDLWLYQEMVWEVKPDLIIETGTAHGGSALFFASLFDIIGKGEIITIDVKQSDKWPQHPRITYCVASSTAPETVQKVAQLAAGKRSVMVILDSEHRKQHVDAELKLYHSFVTPGSYLVVEDTNVNGHPVRPDFGPGPMEALNEFLPLHPEFTVDTSKEKFLVSFNPKGYLKKK